ncbi:terpene synthase family protein [Microbispora sp. GKU 823]|uniref:terpene synthase family protein n=1 Tax=Microbispora sp. GKU 823 TaxID=1652100 RepID=UPI00117C4EB8|nr:terpene synthase family protein [Microbispora sp. GKU 823]
MSSGGKAAPAPVTVPAPSPAPSLAPVSTPVSARAGLPAGEKERVQERLDAWLLDTGLAATPEEARHPRWNAMAATAARFWPDADAEQAETLARWMLVIAVVDDLFDEPGLADPDEIVRLRHRLTLLVRGLDGTPPAGGAVATAMAQAWERIRLVQPPSWRTRALGHLEEWLEAAEREACHRLSGFIPSLRDQFALRLGSSGAPVFLDSFEITYGGEFEPAVRDHPLYRRLLDVAAAAALAENDLRTLDEDEAVGAPYNLVRVLRHETGCTRQEAIDAVTRQVEDGFAQVDAILTAAPAILRPTDGAAASVTGMGLVRLARERLPGWRTLHDIDRYSRSSAGSETYLTRLRRELLVEYAETGAAR